MVPAVALALMLSKEAIQSSVARTLLAQLLKTMAHNPFLKSFVTNLQKLNAKVGLDQLGPDLASQQAQNNQLAQKSQQNQKSFTNQLLTLSKQVGHNHLVLYFANMFVQNLQQLQHTHGGHSKEGSVEAKSTIDIEGNDITGLSEDEAEKLVNDLGTWLNNPNDNPNLMGAYAEATKEMNEFTQYVNGLPRELSETQVEDVFENIDQKAERAAEYVFKMQPTPEPERTVRNDKHSPYHMPTPGDGLTLTKK